MYGRVMGIGQCSMTLELRTGALVPPSLGRHVASKLQEEVSVMKERRKHAE